MDAIVIAGGIPQPQDPLYPFSRGESKALIDIAGKPMVQWVLDALGGAKTIDRVVMVGLTEKSGLSCRKPLYYISNAGRLLANIQAGTEKVVELNRRAEYVLIVTSDIPAINGTMVDWVVNSSMQTKHDIYYNVIARQVMEDRFPTARRTYVRLKDIEACGGDMNVVRTAIVHRNPDFWNRVIEARKKPAAQASILGLDVIFRFIFRQLSADDVIRRLGEKIGLRGRALICPFAEVGMDVDKPLQLELMRSYLVGLQRRRSASHGSARKGSASKSKRSGAAGMPQRSRRKTVPARTRSVSR